MSEASELNTSGIWPVEFKVLVKIDKIGEKTAGGIIIPNTTKDKQELAHTKATVIAVGGNSFEDWKEPIPKPGSRVIMAMYAGYLNKGDDGEEYRLCQDKEIAALLDTPADGS